MCPFACDVCGDATWCAQFVEDVLPEGAVSSPRALLLAIEALVLVLLVPYVFVRRLDLLAHFMSAANLLVLGALTLILVYCFRVAYSFIYSRSQGWHWH